jgi:IS5 family transposase
MIGNSPFVNQNDLFREKLSEMLDHRKPLFKLTDEIPWDDFEKEFHQYYCKNFGAPSKPIRLMVSLLILKQLFDLSDEAVVEKWTENPYYQYFSGQIYFTWELPCDASELTKFRNRIGKEGSEKILKLSIKLHGEDATERIIVVDTTVQEKNITYPTDLKLQVKIIKQCLKIAEKEKIKLRQRYSRIVPKLIMDQRLKRNPKKIKEANKSARKIKTIAGRLTREINRKLPIEKKLEYSEKLEIFKKILSQKQNDKNKIYSIHENNVYCISKGKSHKKYEFGSKVSIALTANTGIVVGVMNFENNIYDGHTMPDVLEQVEKLTGERPLVSVGDRSYKCPKEIKGTIIISPKNFGKQLSDYAKRKIKKLFRRRAGVEPVIGHMKTDFRMVRNFLKGIQGDHINATMAGVAFNLNKWMRKAQKALLSIFDFIFNTQKLKIFCE